MKLFGRNQTEFAGPSRAARVRPAHRAHRVQSRERRRRWRHTLPPRFAPPADEGSAHRCIEQTTGLQIAGQSVSRPHCPRVWLADDLAVEGGCDAEQMTDGIPTDSGTKRFKQNRIEIIRGAGISLQCYAPLLIWKRHATSTRSQVESGIASSTPNTRAGNTSNSHGDEKLLADRIGQVLH